MTPHPPTAVVVPNRADPRPDAERRRRIDGARAHQLAWNALSDPDVLRRVHRKARLIEALRLTT